MSEGFSGSAIVDFSNGRVVGIVFEQSKSDKSLGFAIPIKSITKVCPLLEKINPGLAEHFVLTDISTIFKSYQYFIGEFESIMNNERYIKGLSQTGGLFSLIVIGSNICQKIRNKGKNPSQTVFCNLLACIFDVAKEIIENDFKEIIKKEDTNIKKFNKVLLKENLINNREKIKEILSVFKIYNKWETYLPDHPSITSFRDIMILYLIEEEHVKAFDIRNFILNFNVKLNNKIENNKSIREFYSWWTKKPEVKKLVKYLEEVRASNSYRFDWDKKPLNAYYLSNRSLEAEINTWQMSDESIENHPYYKGKIKEKEPREIIDFYLNEKEEENQYLVIGGTWGIGKSTLCRKIAHDFAQDYLWCRNIESEDLVKHNYYIPIFCPLSSDLGYIDDVLEMLKRMYSNTEQYENLKVLLILDGLNEYPLELESLISALRTYRSTYSNNIKVIITTKVSTEKDSQKIKNALDEFNKYRKFSYIRLLPFTEPQVSNYFEKCGIKKISYEYATSYLNWDGNQIKKPIFTWMLASIYSNPEQKIRRQKKWNETYFYFIFVKNVMRISISQLMYINKSLVL